MKNIVVDLESLHKITTNRRPNEPECSYCSCFNLPTYFARIMLENMCVELVLCEEHAKQYRKIARTKE
jgi:hypothetical protein